jgi:hypothetical protein
MRKRSPPSTAGERTPASVVVLDSNSVAVVASIPTVGTLDGLAYDPSDPDNLRYDAAEFATALGTRTGVWYEKRDRLYLAAPPSGNLGARLLVFEAQTD